VCPCHKCGDCGTCGGCGGDACNNGCQESCGKCCIHEVRKLVVYPCVKEVPVRKCWIEWVCPKCGDCCNGQPAATPAQPTPAPTPTAPAPAVRLPGPPQATGVTPLFSVSGLVQTP